ncbi:glycosyltransferase family 2 protein [Pseudooceanicola nanhaiensis]|uniref:glycosyltransferase family 2 protein n=1 Tax=Pseudooceanicola nanhaiensis TaxID=375761 RepID=UPI001CD537EB|nr:glycosyltransferase family 2 protein [Pseudooceanicola nanhaiensis]MCA0919529.1 glycosyltransferase [Pseudooceanicola nanhaiensis]
MTPSEVSVFPSAAPPRGARSLGRQLVEDGELPASAVIALRHKLAWQDTDLQTLLLTDGPLSEDRLLTLTARSHDLPLWEPQGGRPVSLPELPPALCLRHAVLPFLETGGRLVLVTPDPERLSHPDLPPLCRALPLRIGGRTAIRDTLARQHRATLARAMSHCTPDALSCRRWQGGTVGRSLFALGLPMGALWLALLRPGALFAALCLWALLTLALAMGLRVLALGARLLPPAPRALPPPQHPLACPGHTPKLPRIAILVPLFREASIAETLLVRLQRLDYPRGLLEVVLVLEEDDSLTRQVVADTALPPWFRTVVVPRGRPQTKPRAMNYALDFCEGDIIGIYDAEDAPEADQLLKVARHFRDAAPEVACLQGALDYYNPRQTWIARCFTVEYATWFRVVLPGFARLGLGLPLGGTTLFIRRPVLEEVGRWDAHNVTEDADLGYRLYRRGYRTEILDSTTREEANCFPLPWIKQRSRWLKGYMVTYLVHMRRPDRLLRDLGPWRFLGFNAHFLSALSQFLLAPVFWSMWLIPFGLPHPLLEMTSPALFHALATAFFATECFNIVLGIIAVSGRDHRHLIPWVPGMMLYFPLGCIAAHKALFELVACPFYWDKTQHGHSAPDTG